MNSFKIFIFLFISMMCLLLNFVYAAKSSMESNVDIFKSQYGDGYGTEWIYFPDGNGLLRYVNLTIPKGNMNIVPLGSLSFTIDNIQFRLYIRNEMTYIMLNNQGLAVNESQQAEATNILQSNLPLKLITHGWRSSADIDAILNITDAYLQAQNVNVITVDWSETASCVIYPWAVVKTTTIGVKVAEFLDSLNEEYGVTGGQLHLIGHSLGAHVMGVAASKTISRVHRVTGLDPSRPLFEWPPEATFQRLDSSDADIVDVIHTCAGLLGFEGAIGTVDFFPNNGTAPQPGCESIFKLFDACSHSISFHYFLESIKDPKIYPAYKCASWEDFLDYRCDQDQTGYMGDSATENMTGTYYLHTYAAEPTIMETFLNWITGPDWNECEDFSRTAGAL